MAFGRLSRSNRPEPPLKPPLPQRPYQQDGTGAYHQNTAMSMDHLPYPSPANVPTISSPPPGWTSQALQRSSKWKSYTNLNQSMTHLVSHTVEKTNATILDLENLVHHSLGGGANVNEVTSRLLDQVITSIDLGSFCGRENELSEVDNLLLTRMY